MVGSLLRQRRPSVRSSSIVGTRSTLVRRAVGFLFYIPTSTEFVSQFLCRLPNAAHSHGAVSGELESEIRAPFCKHFALSLRLMNFSCPSGCRTRCGYWVFDLYLSLNRHYTPHSDDVWRCMHVSHLATRCL